MTLKTSTAHSIETLSCQLSSVTSALFSPSWKFGNMEIVARTEQTNNWMLSEKPSGYSHFTPYQSTPCSAHLKRSHRGSKHSEGFMHQRGDGCRMKLQPLDCYNLLQLELSSLLQLQMDYVQLVLQQSFESVHKIILQIPCKHTQCAFIICECIAVCSHVDVFKTVLNLR